MKKAYVKQLFAALLFLTLILNPITAHAATPLTAANFNATRYANDYPDLKAAYGNNAAALWAHYVNLGVTENRTVYATNGDIGYLNTATPATAQNVTANTFDYMAYANNYPDLKAVFGYDRNLLYMHYVTVGQAEGRTLTGTATPSAVATAPAAPASAAVPNNFNYKVYADKYPDLKAVYGYNATALYNHYITYGQKEGRTLSATPATTAVASTTPATEGAAAGFTAASPAPVATAAVFTSVIPNTVAVLGDSISTFAGYNHGGYALYYPHDPIKDVSQMWWMQAAASRGLTVINNCSWSGSTVTGDVNKADGSAGCSWRRITDLAVGGQAPAIILIMLGTNDFQFNFNLGYHRVGEPGASSWNFSGAYDIMLTNVKAAFPYSRIVCLSIPMIWSSEGALINKQGLGAPAYNAKIAEIAAAHGVQVIDIYNVFTGGDSIDGIHPNLKGMSEIAATVAAGL